MKKTLGKETRDFAAFTNIWKFYQEYYEPEKSDEYWEDFIKAGNKLISEYNDVPIVRAFVTAFQYELEKQLKGGE